MKCSRVFGLWRKSTFHIIPLLLKDQEGFPLTSIAAGADLSLGYQNGVREKCSEISFPQFTLSRSHLFQRVVPHPGYASYPS